MNARFAVAVLLLAGTVTGCGRSAAVESGPAPSVVPTAITVAGAYDYRVDADGQIVTGTIELHSMNNQLHGEMTSSMGGVTVTDVQQDGDVVTMQLETPAGPGTAELTWSDANNFTGLVYVGGTAYEISGTRRP